MYTRYYDNYEERARKPCVDNTHEEVTPEEASVPLSECDNGIAVASSPFGILSGLKTDDIVLIGLLLLVLGDGCDDYLLPIILGFLILNK